MPKKTMGRPLAFFKKNLETMPRSKGSNTSIGNSVGIVQYAYRHSIAFKNILDSVGLKPGDIRTIKDLRKNSDHQEGGSGGPTEEESSLRRVRGSSDSPTEKDLCLSGSHQRTRRKRVRRARLGTGHDCRRISAWRYRHQYLQLPYGPLRIEHDRQLPVQGRVYHHSNRRRQYRTAGQHSKRR